MLFSASLETDSELENESCSDLRCARLALNYFSLLGVSVGSSKPDVNYCVSDMSQSQIPSAG